MPVGLFQDWECEFSEVELAPGDLLALYTDGITEAENSRGDQFGDSVLNDAQRLRSVDAVLENVARFQGTLDRNDDWTLFELRYRGEVCQVGVSDP
jgi:sigma-B regulation protein RsbU (phosphoserine phosphatase)